MHSPSQRGSYGGRGGEAEIVLHSNGLRGPLRGFTRRIFHFSGHRRIFHFSGNFVPQNEENKSGDKVRGKSIGSEINNREQSILLKAGLTDGAPYPKVYCFYYRVQFRSVLHYPAVNLLRIVIHN